MAKRFVSVGECMIELSGGEAHQYRMGFAGDTLNSIWYARARLPAEWSTDYVTALGTDAYSTEMRQFLSAHGIGTAHIQTIPERRPGLYMIHQQDGDRHFTYWRENSAARLLADDPAALKAAFEGAALVYFSGITLAILLPRARGRLLKAIVAARNAGSLIAFDPNARPALWKSLATMGAVHTVAASVSDIVLPTFPDEKATFGDASPAATLERYLGLGVGEVVVKDGGDPAHVGFGDRREQVSATAGKVVDATGAGDSFNGAYLAARLTGADPVEAARAAHGVAGIVIGHRGALVDPALVA
ncbi:MAG TPA: sugar kinase [Devosiaceae bacterium]|nr:sugar kinase [Devosiaceae bacterium]